MEQVEIEDYLMKNGYESIIAYCKGMPNENGYKIGMKLDYKIHGLLSRVFGLQGY